MRRVHSHYDNLKVSRDAPSSVIKAAYRALSQQYHPDVAKTPDANRIMSVINRAYDVLSDSEKRRQHDAWLAQQERELEPLEPATAPMPSQTNRQRETQGPRRDLSSWSLWGELLRCLLIYWASSTSERAALLGQTQERIRKQQQG